jgi:pantoate--beta-alanine ligase
VKEAATAVVPSHKLLRLEYFEVVDPEEMQPVETIMDPVVVAGAVWVGATRLIDNVHSESTRLGLRRACRR